uniref:(northern house mosquito) hypothetical protein n=1 Tax=Culex pipiens TaxID=7175 RepID=A0A8D8BL53_CULPI
MFTLLLQFRRFLGYLPKNLLNSYLFKLIPNNRAIQTKASAAHHPTVKTCRKSFGIFPKVSQFFSATTPVPLSGQPKNQAEPCRAVASGRVAFAGSAAPSTPGWRSSRSTFAGPTSRPSRSPECLRS